MAGNQDQPPTLDDSFICCHCGVTRFLELKNNTPSCDGPTCTHNPFWCYDMKCYTTNVGEMKIAVVILLQKRKSNVFRPICQHCDERGDQHRRTCNGERQYKCDACQAARHTYCLPAIRRFNQNGEAEPLDAPEYQQPAAAAATQAQAQAHPGQQEYDQQGYYAAGQAGGYAYANRLEAGAYHAQAQAQAQAAYNAGNAHYGAQYAAYVAQNQAYYGAQNQAYYGAQNPGYYGAQNTGHVAQAPAHRPHPAPQPQAYPPPGVQPQQRAIMPARAPEPQYQNFPPQHLRRSNTGGGGPGPVQTTANMNTGQVQGRFPPTTGSTTGNTPFIKKEESEDPYFDEEKETLFAEQAEQAERQARQNVVRENEAREKEMKKKRTAEDRSTPSSELRDSAGPGPSDSKGTKHKKKVVKRERHH